MATADARAAAVAARAARTQKAMRRMSVDGDERARPWKTPPQYGRRACGSSKRVRPCATNRVRKQRASSEDGCARTSAEGRSRRGAADAPWRRTTAWCRRRSDGGGSWSAARRELARVRIPRANWRQRARARGGADAAPSRAREHRYRRQPASAHRQPSGAGKMENVQPSTMQLISGALASRTPRCSSAAQHRPRCCWGCNADAAGRQHEQRPAHAHRAAGPFCSALGSVRQRRRCRPRRCVRCRAAARRAPPSARGAERGCLRALPRPLRPTASLTINQLLT